MRPGQNKRLRGGGRNNNPHSPQQGGGGGGGGNGGSGGGGNRGPRPPHRSQVFDSNGPNGKFRGNAYQVFERYVAMARDAAASGDRVLAESLYQHAEHYYRIMNANGEAQPPRPTTPADTDQMDGDNDGEPEMAEAIPSSTPMPPQQPESVDN